MLKNPNRTNPDILDCIASLSNDEVFTSPKLANQMLDIVPQELFTDPNAKFLDPFCKTGVFLREIVKRLNEGLKEAIPDQQERIDHILHNQIFGIAITSKTAFLARRTVYCSKYASQAYSVSKFTDADMNEFCINRDQGNVRFNRAIKHTFNSKGVCTMCGASNDELSESEHAYELIHLNDETLEEFKKMKWDLIIGNPPYQLNDSSLSPSATPIYNKFIEQAKKLHPKYLVEIIPSRWMAGGKGLDSFRDEMINDKHITVLHDFLDAEDCFPNNDIKGGVCYFLREEDSEDQKCNITLHYPGNHKTVSTTRYLKEDGMDIFIRHPELIDIRNKIWADTTQTSFSTIVSSQKPYGFRTDFFAPTVQKTIDGKKQKVSITTEEKYGLVTPLDTPIEGGYEILGLISNKRIWKYVDKDYAFPKKDGLGKWKIFISKAYGSGAIGECPSTPVLGTPTQSCTETFLQIGTWNNEEEAKNALKYIKTKFFRCLVGIYKQTQDASNRIYRAVPLQNFNSDSDINWSESIDDIDHQLYTKYQFTDTEIEFIETNIAPMNDATVNDEEVETEEIEE